MHPARLKAKQAQALAETAGSLAGLDGRLARIEARQDEILARLGPTYDHEAKLAIAKNLGQPRREK